MAAGERSADADGHRRSARLWVLQGRRVVRVASTDEVGCGELIGCARRGCLFAAQMLRFTFSPAIFWYPGARWCFAAWDVSRGKRSRENWDLPLTRGLALRYFLRLPQKAASLPCFLIIEREIRRV